METIFTSTAASAEASLPTKNIHQHAALIVDLIKSNFGKGEFLVRCLSLNATGASRCNATAKKDCLFCATHAKAGVIASPELLAAYQMNPDQVRPFLAQQKQTGGGLFETKAAKDAVKVKATVPKLKKKVETNNCKKTNGDACTTPTKFSDGYCHHHRSQAPVEPLVQQAEQIIDPVALFEEDVEAAQAVATPSKPKRRARK